MWAECVFTYCPTAVRKELTIVMLADRAFNFVSEIEYRHHAGSQVAEKLQVFSRDKPKE
jgi:hypothetical protein